ncbi:MAG: ribosome assembly RNA-binding protein YhbY [Labilithrix sp.]|nr:ribosome assembly RNA-binding protein YhbY [Labilithrix sp.]
MSRPTTAKTKKKTSGPGPKRLRALDAARQRKKGDLRSARAAEPKSDAAQTAAEEARALSGKATRYLRGLGHHLEPVVQIGKDGITEGVVTATRAALLAHELVKVRILTEAPVDRKEAGAELARRAGAALAQTLGRTLLLYKRHPHKPKIVLPR